MGAAGAAARTGCFRGALCFDSVGDALVGPLVLTKERFEKMLKHLKKPHSDRLALL